MTSNVESQAPSLSRWIIARQNPSNAQNFQQGFGRLSKRFTGCVSVPFRWLGNL